MTKVGRSRVLQTVEREIYAQAIKRAGGNLKKAIKWLGVVTRAASSSQRIAEDLGGAGGTYAF
jgi:hypothetical protein